MARGLNFQFFDASDESDSVEGFEEIQDGLRELFRSEIAPLVIAQYGEGDEISLNEAFNVWTDSLCKDGKISDHIYNHVTRTDD